MKTLLTMVLLLTFALTTALPVYGRNAGAVTPSGIPLSAIEGQIDELIANYMHQFTPGLAVAVVKDGEIIFSRGYGYGSLERQMPIDPATTVFAYGSVSKLLVYVSTMQLVEQGILDLDANIHDYLPEDLSRQFNFEKSFTMRDLLNHSAGFGESVLNFLRDAEDVETPITLREGLVANQPRQLFEPGTASSYSNFGTALAAYIVGYISGQEFAEFERENILDTLEMFNTKNQPDWLGNEAFLQNKPRGHVLNGEGGFQEFIWSYFTIYPAGSLIGTAEDLAQLAIALTPPQGESGPLFNSRDTLDLMLSPSYLNPNIMRGTHHGFMSYDGILPTFGHPGGTLSFNSEFAIVPSERFGVVMLSNADGGRQIIDKILDLLVGNQMDTIASITDNMPSASNMAGEYVMLRRHEGNILEPINFLLNTNVSVNAIDENTIIVSMYGSTFTYKQIEPYIFRLISADGALSAVGRMLYEIHFRMENGKPVGISTGSAFDATIQTFGQSMTALMGGLAIILSSLLFFFITPFIILVGFLRKKDKENVNSYHIFNGLLLSGTLLAINNIVLFLRLFAAAPIIQTPLLVPHVWINYTLLILTGGLLVVSLVFFMRNNVGTKRKILYFSTISFLALFTFILWQWNFFEMI